MASLIVIVIACLLVFGQSAARPQSFPVEREMEELEPEESDPKESSPKAPEPREPEPTVPKTLEPGKSGNFNEFLDGILKESGPAIRKYADPLTLPDTDSALKRNVFNVNGGFKTFHGILRGLSTLHRAGDATIETDEEKVPTIRATLAINDLHVGTDAKAWLGAIDIPFYMGAKVKYLKGTLEFKIPQEEGQKPRASKLTIDDIGEVALTFDRLGPLNWVLEKTGYLFMNALKGTIKNRISAPILSAINQNIDKANLESFFK